MITDHRPHTRELGLRKMIKARAVKPSGKIRKFKVHTNLSFDAAKHFELINWTNLPIAEPPVLKTRTDTEFL